mgnify:CR=1 FL=1
MSFKFTALACKFWILKNSLTYTSYQWGRKALHDYWLKGFFQLLLDKDILNFADWILYLVYALYLPSFFCSKLNVLIYSALPVFCHNKVTESFVSSEKEESKWMQQRKGPASFVQSFEGNRKFLTVRNSLADLRQEKARKTRMKPWNDWRHKFLALYLLKVARRLLWAYIRLVPYPFQMNVKECKKCQESLWANFLFSFLIHFIVWICDKMGV